MLLKFLIKYIIITKFVLTTKPFTYTFLQIIDRFKKKTVGVLIYITSWQHPQECMCRLRNIALRDYQESVTTGQTD